MRHLVVCDNDITKTITHIEAEQMWRQIQFPLAFVPYATPVFYVHGHDTEGHPLLIVNDRFLNPKDNCDEKLRWMVQMIEVALQRMPKHLMQFTLFVNRVGADYELDFEFIKRFKFKVDNYYPERLNKIVVHPTSLALRGVLTLLKTIFGARGQFFNVTSSLEELRKFVPEASIPSDMGGSQQYAFRAEDFRSVHDPAYCGTRSSNFSPSSSSSFSSSSPHLNNSSTRTSGTLNLESVKLGQREREEEEKEEEDTFLEEEVPSILYHEQRGDNVFARGLVQSSVGAKYQKRAETWETDTDVSI